MDSKYHQQYSVVLNTNNVVPNTKNSVLKYKFDNAMTFKNAYVSLNTLNIFHSWFNISSDLNNNKLSYMWFDSSGNLTVSHEIIITDGYYSVNNLNEKIQSIFRSRGHYVQKVSDSTIGYYIEFIENASYYSIQLNCFAMMTSAQAGSAYTRGSTSWAFPSVKTTVQCIIQSSNKFSQLIGFQPGTYPTVSSTSDRTFLSTITPNMNPVSSVLMTCSFCSQGGFSNPDNIIYSFTADTIFGGMIDKAPSNAHYVKIRDGVYTHFTIEFVDQNLQRIDIKDPQILVMLNFRIPSEEK